MDSNTKVKKNKKRQRKDISSAQSTEQKKSKKDNTIAPKNAQKKQKNPLNGIILAITTCEGNDTDAPSTQKEFTYKEACKFAQSMGASTTAQVHNRVYAVVCNKSAVYQSTQRVRKALKKNIPIIDIQWLLECQKERKRVDPMNFVLTDEAKELANKRQEIQESKAREVKEVDVADESDEEALQNANGWSEPVQYGCCCVCHDDDRDDCKWCSGEEKCSVIQKKLGLI